MSHPAPPASLDVQRERITRMVEVRAPFIEVEQIIARSPVPPEQKAELWTFAWSLLGSERQRQQIQWITDQAPYRKASS